MPDEPHRHILDIYGWPKGPFTFEKLLSLQYGLNGLQLLRPFRAINYYMPNLGLKPQALRKNPSGILEQERGILVKG
jgi:hypothetical protein